MSLKSTILEYLESNYPEAIHKGVIGKKAVLEWGYENENAGRRLRELENEGKIQVIYNSKHEATYRAVHNSISKTAPDTVKYKQLEITVTAKPNSPAQVTIERKGRLFDFQSPTRYAR